jgi:hypothetical protein
MMKIELRRALEPEEMVEAPCGLCGVPFEDASVVAAVVGIEVGADFAPACPTCVEYFGQRSPETFPTLEEYEAAKVTHPSPVWASTAELMILEERDPDAACAAYEAAWLARTG